MRVRVLFFASCRDLVGQKEVAMDLPEGARVADLVREVISAHPRFEGLAGRVMVSVNQEYAGSETVLNGGDEVAFIPPVSGGSPRATVPCPVSPTEGRRTRPPRPRDREWG